LAENAVIRRPEPSLPGFEREGVVVTTGATGGGKESLEKEKKKEKRKSTGNWRE